jgi:hypothetical protein
MAIAAVFEFPGEPVEKYHKVFEAGDAIVDRPDRMYHYHGSSAEARPFGAGRSAYGGPA